MKRLLIILMLSTALVGCKFSMAEQQYRTQRNIPQGTDDIVDIEGCEYFKSTVRDGTVYTHKGNCKNTIHYCSPKN